MNVSPTSLRHRSSLIKPPGEARGSEPLLRLKGLSKRYGETAALEGVSLQFTSGRVHGLVGENGAGKSTLVKIMSGLERPNSGTLSFEGKVTVLESPRHALEIGISTVHQELTLAPKLTVAENLLMGWHAREDRQWIRSHRTLDQLAEVIMQEWELDGVRAYSLVHRLSLGSQQQLEIVRACARKPRLLILDEPTAALGAPAVEWLFRQLEKLRRAGTCIVYISHRLNEVRLSCSDITVLRNGRQVGTFDNPEQVPEGEIIRMIAGREIAELERMPMRPPRPDAKSALEAHSISIGRTVLDVSFELRAGEVLGVAALEGSGQRELFLALFGALALDRGEVIVEGRRVRFRSPKEAVDAGLALVPEDRKSGGLLLDSSLTVNVALGSLGKFQRLGFFRGRSAHRESVNLLASLGVAYSSVEERARTLSGGNQQKIVLAKWLAADSRIFLMYDPTRGVDPGTKLDIYAQLRNLVDEGRSMLFYSTELEEVLNLSHRILVLYRGRVVREFDKLPVKEEKIVAAMMGIVE